MPAAASGSKRTGDVGRISLGIFAKSAAGPINKDLGRISGSDGASSLPDDHGSGPLTRAASPEGVATGQTVAPFDEHRRLAERRDRWRNQRAAAGLLPGERVRDCQRSLKAIGVDVVREESGRTAYSGLLTCDSRWHCPICAAKLTEADRRELQRGMQLWIRDGGACYLLTFTFPHDRALPLGEAVEKMQRAQREMKAKRAYKKIMAEAGALGSVKALEVTYGENGWHPHVHMLVFARPDAVRLADIRGLWGAAVERVGLGKINEHGFDCRGGDYAAEYVAKFGREANESRRPLWTAAHELTKGHQKQGRRLKGATPFTLLRWYREGDAQAGALFREYAAQFKGKAQLYWSPRLRSKIDLLELQDPRPAPPRPVVLVSLSREDWHAIVRHDARWEVLYVAERYGGDAVRVLVERMRRSRGRWRGDFRERDGFTGRMVDMNGPALHAEAA